jgi:hypothetical protein
VDRLPPAISLGSDDVAGFRYRGGMMVQSLGRQAMAKV